MCCPTLAELPSPPPDKTGWPWTEESLQSPDMMLDNRPWPRISVVTPSYNHGQYIEETIRSVLLQGYPNLEFIIMDGGSADQTVASIKKYEPWISYWVSERDRGQAHAINKGWDRSTGEILVWLNSDDMYLPGALLAIGNAYRSNPDSIIAGNVINFGPSLDQKHRLIQQKNLTWRRFVKFWEASRWHQPGIFIPRTVWQIVGPLDEGFYYCMDRDFLARALRYASVTYIDTTLVYFRIHPDAKTMRQQNNAWFEEKIRIVKKYQNSLPNTDYATVMRFWCRTAYYYMMHGKIISSFASIRDAVVFGWRWILRMQLNIQFLFTNKQMMS